MLRPRTERCNLQSFLDRRTLFQSTFPEQQFLYFFLEPHGHGSFRPIFLVSLITVHQVIGCFQVRSVHCGNRSENFPEVLIDLVVCLIWLGLFQNGFHSGCNHMCECSRTHYRLFSHSLGISSRIWARFLDLICRLDSV